MKRLLAAVACLALASACGTTVQNAGQVAGPDALATSAAQGGSASAPVASGGLAPTNPQAGTTGSTVGGAPGVGGATGATGSAPGTVIHPNTGGVATTGRGWDAGHVYLGVMTQKDFQKTFASVGYSGIDPGDTQAQAQAVVDELNRQGGVLGRKVVIRTFDVPTLSSAQNPDNAAQQACTYFTQDAPVVAIVNIVATMDNANFRTCIAKHQVPLFDGSITPQSNAEAASLSPYFYSLATPAWDTLAPVLVSRLKAQGYFQGWDPRLSKVTTGTPVIGVLVADTTLGHADEKAIMGALKAAGYKRVISFAYPPPGSEIDGAVLNFEQNGVTHVISDNVELVTFQIHAQSQRYAPRYGINTYNAPSTNLEPLGPSSQQIGEVGVGWGPTLDVSAANDPGAFSPAVTTCKGIMAKHQVTSSDRLAEVFAMIVCDAVRLGVQGMTGGKGLDGRSIFAGVSAAGPAFSSAFTFASGLSARRPLMPAAVRDIAYVPSCSCFRYSGSTLHRM